MTKKKKLFLAGVTVLGLGFCFIAVKAFSARGDIVAGQFFGGAIRGSDAWRVDSTGNARLYHGSLVLGDNGTRPGYLAPSGTTSGTYYGFKVPFFNGGGASTAQGTVIIASGTATTQGAGSFAAVLGTTTLLGVADGVYADQTVGYMTVAGYALVLTTGTVHIGDILISTDGTSAAGAAGYAGAKSSPSAGTILGVAFSSGNANGGLTLVKLAS